MQNPQQVHADWAPPVRVDLVNKALYDYHQQYGTAFALMALQKTKRAGGQ
jgi:hypothetical protein